MLCTTLPHVTRFVRELEGSSTAYFRHASMHIYTVLLHVQPSSTCESRIFLIFFLQVFFILCPTLPHVTRYVRDLEGASAAYFRHARMHATYYYWYFQVSLVHE
jgi:hypothetical protein